MKKSQDGSPSTSFCKTLHIRNLPSDATEQDLIALACPFGRVVNVLLLKGKNQALIQMQDIQCTGALTQYYSSVRASIRGRPIYFQYSNRDEITAGQQQGPDQQNHILLVTVLNVLFPVDIDVLNRVFSKYGNILKIVIFNKSAGLQSLIQFADINSAVAAKVELDSQNIYSGCCTLRIQFSSLSNLNVKYNNEKSRDFTNPSLPTTRASTLGGNLPLLAPDGSIYSTSWINPSQSISPYNYPYSNPLNNPFSWRTSPKTLIANTPVLIVSGLDSERETPDSLFTLFGVYGDVIRVKILHSKRDTALIQFVNAQQAETALSHLNGCSLHGNTLRVNFSKHTSISMPRSPSEEGVNLTKDFTGSMLHRYKVVGSRNFQHICLPSAVLHLSNIPESASDDMVRDLFSQSGTVVGFRFFQKDRRMGLIQMGSIAEAVEALINTHNYQMDGSNIKVSFSNSNL